VPKELAKLGTEFNDVKKRVGPMLENMELLNNNFWNETSGNWNRYFSGVDLLAERLKALGASSASDAKAASDGEVKAIVKGIATAKADCLSISKEYWTTLSRVAAIAKEVGSLKAKVDAVIKQKSGILTRSKSLPALQTLSKNLERFKNELDLTTKVGQGPHRPDSALYK
jgi:hypothetical protein